MKLFAPHCLSLVSLLLMPYAGPAWAEDWAIARIAGEAWVSVPNEPVAKASAGMTIPDGATFSTAQTGRAQLARGAEIILVSPNTTISPRSTTFFSSTTTIVQQTGRIELDVEKSSVRHFSVKTPLLTAVVKGARLTVSVTGQSADVQVARGVVEVSDLRNGDSVGIGPGQRASVGGMKGSGLEVTGVATMPDARKEEAGPDERSGPKGPSGSSSSNGAGSTGAAGAGKGSNGASGNSSGGSPSDGGTPAGNGNGGGKAGDNSNSGGNGNGRGGNSASDGNGGENPGGGNPGGNGNAGGHGNDNGGSGGKGRDR